MSEYHRAYSVVKEAKRPFGQSHQRGTCGGHADLCAECHRLEWEWHKAITLLICQDMPPQPKERYADYWHRVGGRFLDTWYSCAALAFQETGTELPPLF